MNKLFNDYDKFIDKFKPKKTTDDCYTPAPVYDAVLNFVQTNCDIKGMKVVRPFYPGGNYEDADYENSVVIDNPPFSIISKICSFFMDRKIKFFLFAPHLTIFGLLSNDDIQVVVNDDAIIYANGAKVKTSFVTNLFPGYRVLYRRITEGVQPRNDTKKAIYFPKNAITAARLRKSMPFDILKDESIFTHKVGGIKIFGAALIISDAAAARIEAARIEAERIALRFTSQEEEIVKILNKKNQ